MGPRLPTVYLGQLGEKFLNGNVQQHICQLRKEKRKSISKQAAKIFHILVHTSLKLNFACNRPHTCVPVCSEPAAAIHRRGDALLHTWRLLRYISPGSLKIKVLWKASDTHNRPLVHLSWRRKDIDQVPGIYVIISSNVFFALLCLSWGERGGLLSQKTVSGIRHLKEYVKKIPKELDTFLPKCVWCYLAAGWWVKPAGAPAAPGSVCAEGSGQRRLPVCSWTGSCRSLAGGAASRGRERRLGLTTRKKKAEERVRSVIHRGPIIPASLPACFFKGFS